MPQKVVTKSEVIPPNGVMPRALLFSMTSTQNRPEWPRRNVPGPLNLQKFDATACQNWEDDNGNNVSPDAPNLSSSYKLVDDPWDQRLYASAYSKFASEAQNGSAQWGMNALQWRKSLGTLYSLASTSAVSVAAVAKGFGKALEYLKKYPDTSPKSLRGKRKWLSEKKAKNAADRIRLNNEIWLLDQVSSLLLAYRYAISPIMSDIHSTADILSRDVSPDESISHRVARKRVTPYVWSYGHPTPLRGERGTFTESVVLKCTTTVSNPNLHLASQLGITNPAYWIWDAMPWSFVVDWWFGVGDFLNSFTATLGLTFSNASVTRTRTYEGRYTTHKSYYPPYSTFSGHVKSKRKHRSVGSLPWPSAVPYGNGLGLQRAQNALALVGQLLSRKSSHG